ncbi:MAG TPA: very short patch repair endonuclease [Geobacteraceae bacterium]
MDIVNPQERSRIMGNIRARGNKSTELKLIKLFKKNGLTGWKRNYPVKGKPDFVFLPQRVAIFVDGCFWHGCEEHCHIPSSNQSYWLAKINRNKERDIAITTAFQNRNWKVIRIWEHELTRKNSIEVLNRIKIIV